MEFAKSFEETSPSTPIFFILSPGVNPLKDVETLGKSLGFSADAENFHKCGGSAPFLFDLRFAFGE